MSIEVLLWLWACFVPTKNLKQIFHTPELQASLSADENITDVAALAVVLGPFFLKLENIYTAANALASTPNRDGNNTKKIVWRDVGRNNKWPVN